MIVDKTNIVKAILCVTGKTVIRLREKPYFAVLVVVTENFIFLKFLKL